MPYYYDYNYCKYNNYNRNNYKKDNCLFLIKLAYLENRLWKICTNQNIVLRCIIVYKVRLSTELDKNVAINHKFKIEDDMIDFSKNYSRNAGDEFFS